MKKFLFVLCIMAFASLGGCITPTAESSGNVVQEVSQGKVTKAVEQTEEPVATPEPAVTEEPVATPEPAVTEERTATPAPTETPESTATPAPTAMPAPIVTPAPTATPAPTVTPAPTATPAPTVTPAPTATPAPNATPAPTATPVPTATPKPVHTHTYTDEVTKEAGCDTKGTLTSTCEECGNVKTTVIPSLGGHAWDDGVITTEPTCAEKGIKTYACAVCGKTKTGWVAATGEHIYSETGVVALEPTCKKEGKYQRTCLTCNKIKTEAIPITDDVHKWDGGKVTVEPTKTEGGICVYMCDICNKKREEVTPTYDFDPADYGDPYHVRTSNNPDNYIDFSISGSTLIVQGKLDIAGLDSVWVQCNGIGNPVSARAGELFTVNCPLQRVTSQGEVTVFTRTVGESLYNGYSWRDIVVEYTGGEYRIATSLVLSHNIEIMSHWKNPAQGSLATVSDVIVAKSNEIVGGETDPYRKLYLLNQWVAENIYYDRDYINDKTQTRYSKAEDVLEHKRTVCAGYVNLLQRLIIAQGIPCIQVATYSTGAGTSGSFNEDDYMMMKANHAHAEAFVDGKWVVMDPTWDSNNKYENGEYNYETSVIRYFDATLEFLSYTHLLRQR